MPRREESLSFLPRMYTNMKELTVKSDPRLLIEVVNNLRKILKRRNTSSAPISRATRDFFANILRRTEE